MRQLGDVERLLGVSMAQQDTVSLAQMLQVKRNPFEIQRPSFFAAVYFSECECVTCDLFLNFILFLEKLSW